MHLSAVAANKDAPKAQDKEQKEKDKDKGEGPDRGGGVKTANPHYVEYVTGAVFTALACRSRAAAGLAAGERSAGDRGQRGKSAGPHLDSGGLWLAEGGHRRQHAKRAFFYRRWGESITNRLDKGQGRKRSSLSGRYWYRRRRVADVSAHPATARAEERDNRTLRQLIYGANTGLSVLVLVLILLNRGERDHQPADSESKL